jgi:tRNA-(ms[2]io[6]A)-hydroxylase
MTTIEQRAQAKSTVADALVRACRKSARCEDRRVLAQVTRPTWIEAACRATETILIDHAHCEKKAASTAVGFLFRYPEREALAQAMSKVAREELVHFERVLGELRRRGVHLKRMPPSLYGAELYKCVRSWQPAKLVDELLVSALIEARSCERFSLLADALADDDPELAALYRELGPSETRHAALYLELAEQVAPREEVRARLRTLAAREAAIVAAPGVAVRLHAG